VACGVALTDTFVHFLCKSLPRFFRLDAATVVRRVRSSATTALRLNPRGRAPAGEVEPNTNDAPRRISAVALRVTEAMATLTLQWALRYNV
jgi:hypothetical protein